MAKRWGYVNKSEQVQEFQDSSNVDSLPTRLKNLTKGDAAYIIMKKVVAHQKLEAAQKREKQRQAREHVRVGPLDPY